MSSRTHGEGATASISTLLRQLQSLLMNPGQQVSPDFARQVGVALSQLFRGQLSTVQTTLLLHDLYYTKLEQHPEVLKECARVMTDAAELPDTQKLKAVVQSRALGYGEYHGGLCDIVGTGGDNHATFNISTTSSILASTLLLVAKHGNRASTSKSGSSDVLARMRTPDQLFLDRVTPENLHKVYSSQNYGYLYAPNFHKGLGGLASTRRQIPHPTIFNLLGPLTNPADKGIEARMIGVKKKELVPIFAEALRLHGVKKGIVACGDEDLDEISCAGPTHCAQLVESRNDTGESTIVIKEFKVVPEDFGVPRHSLSEVSPGQSPQQNAEIMKNILTGNINKNDPILHFVLINTACFFVTSGVCEGETSPFGDEGPVMTERGPGGGRWKEGTRLARYAVESGKAWETLVKFTQITHNL